MSRVPSPTRLRGAHARGVRNAQRDAELAKTNAPTPIPSAPGSLAGKSILDLMWEELDSILDNLMDPDIETDEWDKGRATGLAYCISLVQNPYLSNVDEVRQEAKRRWQARQDGEPVPPLRTRP